MEEKKNYVTVEELVKVSNDYYLKLLNENRLEVILKAIGLFPDQTILNDILILGQNNNATCVKRMKDWNYYHRNIIKGEKAIKVISHHRETENNNDNGELIISGNEKLVADVGYLFDISQTQGKNYDYLNSNKETIASYFEQVKSSLEKSLKSYEFKYSNIENNFEIDNTNKVILIKDGLTINELINTLIESVVTTLFTFRKEEGIKPKDKANIRQIEIKSAIYAINSRLGLDLPKADFSEVVSYTDEEKVLFETNLRKVRSVTKQVLSNIENTIEYSIRNLGKPKEKKPYIASENKQEKPKIRMFDEVLDA